MTAYLIWIWLYTFAALALLLALDMTHEVDFDSLALWRRLLALALVAVWPVSLALGLLAYGTRYRDAVLSWFGAAVRG